MTKPTKDEILTAVEEQFPFEKEMCKIHNRIDLLRKEFSTFKKEVWLALFLLVAVAYLQYYAC